MKRIVRFVLVGALVGALLFGLGEIVRISPGWSLWAVAIGVAFVVEVFLGLYRYECGAVTPKRARWMVGMRMASLVVMVWILIEPTWVRNVSKEYQREVVVVLDDSASMHLSDDGASASRLELGEQALVDAGVVEKLGETMRVRTLRAARSIRGDDEQVDEGWLRRAAPTFLHGKGLGPIRRGLWPRQANLRGSRRIPLDHRGGETDRSTQADHRTALHDSPRAIAH